MFVNSHYIRILAAAAVAATVLGAAPAAIAVPAGAPQHQVSTLVPPEPGPVTRITTAVLPTCGAGRFVVCAAPGQVPARVPLAAVHAMESDLGAASPATYHAPPAAVHALQAEIGG
jgi:hypothetical protein